MQESLSLSVVINNVVYIMWICRLAEGSSCYSSAAVLYFMYQVPEGAVLFFLKPGNIILQAIILRSQQIIKNRIIKI